MQVRLIWITPNAEQHIAYCARVSNPANQDNPDIAGLLRYCYNNKHWSIFEMANACIEIETSRAISAQIIRHKSMSFPDGEEVGMEFHFQEFSQRYSTVQGYQEHTPTKQTGRQAAEVIHDDEAIERFRTMEAYTWAYCRNMYEEALIYGYSRECARTLLPMNSSTRLYMNGTIRSWIHYLQVRNESHTQYDHRALARDIEAILSAEMPIIAEVAGWM